ncbi:MAG TPA: ankyrin repeat domain-containing protein [Steroidobacteraceae bacterium]|nr:ankyrin repeat domain-containing protein [Steroidobacteraceae bacterium]
MRRSSVTIALLALGCTSLAQAASAPEAGDGTTPLHWAVYNGDAEQVRSLIKSGADVNARNDYGSTPLTEAAETGNVQIIGQLLKAGADPESSNDDGQTALMILARTSNIAAAELLLKARAKVNAAEKWRGQTALMWAAAEQQPEMVKLLIRHGADVNARSTVNDWKRYVTAEGRKQDRNPGGFTALLYAARQGCVECARALLKGGANVNLADPDGITPLLMAVMSMHFDTARLLIESGANVDKWDWWGRSPLYAAVDVNTLPTGGRPDRLSTDEATSLDIIRLLLERGANPDARLRKFPPYRALGPDRGGDGVLTTDATPLLRAAKGADIPAIKLLLAAGANPNQAQVDGVTPLMAAVRVAASRADTRGEYVTQEEAIEVARVLVAAGADIHARSRPGVGLQGPVPGRSAAEGAAAWGWNKVVAALVEMGAEAPRTAPRGAASTR